MKPLQITLPLDGFCHGPLFAPIRKRRPPRDRSGTAHWRKWMRSRPSLEDRRVFNDLVTLGRIYTKFTGVQHSVDHIVPLNHPLVCGFHRIANFEILPLADNVRKSNNHWPDMPAVQGELL